MRKSLLLWRHNDVKINFFRRNCFFIFAKNADGRNAIKSVSGVFTKLLPKPKTVQRFERLRIKISNCFTYLCLKTL